MSQIITDLEGVLSDYLLVTQPPAAPLVAPAPAGFVTDFGLPPRFPVPADHQYVSITLDECAQQFEDLVNFR